MKYLAEIGLSPHIIAGTSMGALNGAVLASNYPFPQAVKYLDQLWTELGEASIINPNINLAKSLVSYALQTTLPNFSEWILGFLRQTTFFDDEFCIFNPKPIEDFLYQAVDPVNLRNGIELWIAAFPSLNIPGIDYDLLMALFDLFRARTGTKADWLCLQDCQHNDQIYSMLLASAAIPLAFPKREVNGQHYVDGALADNVPLGALAERGCTHAIVIHLENGAAWDRNDFPDQTILEIRPEEQIHKSNIPLIGDMMAVLDFSPSRIAELKCQGYADAKRCLESLIQSLTVIGKQRKSINQLIHSTQSLLDDPPL
uniref:Patatin n=1 Tax=Cyanothece sp. (strain PCC 7425 / ATCC 29141) TaxID=395961 RepID=B8HLV4_CYAP4